MRGTLERYLLPIIVGVEFALFGHALARGASPWLVAFFAFLTGYTLLVTIQALLLEQDTRRLRYEQELMHARMHQFMAMPPPPRPGMIYVQPTGYTPPGGTRHDA